jgi:hypothetical protein
VQSSALQEIRIGHFLFPGHRLFRRRTPQRDLVEMKGSQHKNGVLFIPQNPKIAQRIGASLT